METESETFKRNHRKIGLFGAAGRGLPVADPIIFVPHRKTMDMMWRIIER